VSPEWCQLNKRNIDILEPFPMKFMHVPSKNEDINKLSKRFEEVRYAADLTNVGDMTIL
jgi:hypothetical protein